MSRNKMLVLFVLVLPLLASLACGGTEEEAAPEAAPNTNASDVEAVEPTTSPVPEEFKDVAVMQGSVVMHKSLGYIMSEKGISQAVLDKRATCFTALSQEQESDSCSANLEGEFSRMPGVCTCSPKAEAGKTGICSYAE